VKNHWRFCLGQCILGHWLRAGKFFNLVEAGIEGEMMSTTTAIHGNFVIAHRDGVFFFFFRE